MQGKFITFEGPEGAGKSTQIRLCADMLRRQGYDPVITREPGGVDGAERIRALLVNGDPDLWTDLTECLLMNAARAEHLAKLIRPALASGKTVLCDRFMDSTRAYQGAGGDMPMQELLAVERIVVGDTTPDLTFIFDVPVEVGLARAKARGGDDRFERKPREYHECMRQCFLDIAVHEPKRCAVINAADSVENVTAQVRKIFDERFAVS